jgi:hypothetical protein
MEQRFGEDCYRKLFALTFSIRQTDDTELKERNLEVRR